ncbi:peptidoglycan DD-metalloendopeptidase family protein [Buchnera aphidicola]|uniref:peptidoglycan DD-metalloendopeptidase family protein n=1 Tax=Buchnera aphidicola TaxID=9 RepID=UPI0021C63F61|nr:peptidoglycan DD-metalloendopeptidase family protein [Buchnera aphidicola]
MLFIFTIKKKKKNIKQYTFNISNNNFIGIFKKNRFKIFYIVKSKDTLYSIAKKYGHNYYELSKFNFINKPYKIIVGQKIWIGDFLIDKNKNNCFILTFNNNNKKYTSCEVMLNQTFKWSKFFKNHIQYKTSQICFFYNNEIKKNYFFSNKKSFDSSEYWNWPIKSKNIQYEYHDKSNNKEIEFFGVKDQPVFAAATGRVMFITNEFKKYGRLIILKHKNNYLSIYAFNNLIFVKQKEMVYVNQKIATMGLSDTKIAKLYFEVRYRGKSINPLNLLSKNGINK